MKKPTILMGLIFTFCGATAQEITPPSPIGTLTREDYRTKSKSQKTGAIVLLSAGGAVAIAGAAIAMNEFGDELGNLFSTEPDNTSSNETLSGVLFFTGAAAMLGSIPLFVASNRNKRKAMNLGVKNEPVNTIIGGNSITRNLPALRLTIAL